MPSLNIYDFSPFLVFFQPSVQDFFVKKGKLKLEFWSCFWFTSFVKNVSESGNWEYRSHLTDRIGRPTRHIEGEA